MKTQPISRTQEKLLCVHNKPKFQTKYKMRSTKREIPTVPIQKQPKSRCKTQIQQSQFPLCPENTEMDNSRWAIDELCDHSGQCLCEQCNCGRHLCNFYVTKPSLTRRTTYNNEFGPKKAVENKVRIATEYGRVIGPNLEISSRYFKDFNKKDCEIERPRPNDCLKTEGPQISLTSYSTNFPGHHGDNQYVKVTDKHKIGSFPLRCRTTYSQSFSGTPIKRRGEERARDNLKTGSNWYGKTTYSNMFSSPNPEYFAAISRHLEKAIEVPAYNQNQTKTVYKTNFVYPERKLCPAKILINNNSKAIFAKNKAKFSENTDFKALDRSIRPLSSVKY